MRLQRLLVGWLLGCCKLLQLVGQGQVTGVGWGGAYSAEAALLGRGCQSHCSVTLLPLHHTCLLTCRLVVAPPRLEVAVGVGVVHWRRRFRRQRRQR